MSKPESRGAHYDILGSNSPVELTEKRPAPTLKK